MALTEIVDETKLVRQVQEEFIIPTLRSCTIPIMEDNQGEIEMANNKHIRRRMCYIDVKYHIVHDAVEERLGRIVYVRSDDQHANKHMIDLDIRTFVLHTKALTDVK